MRLARAQKDFYFAIRNASGLTGEPKLVTLPASVTNRKSGGNTADDLDRDFGEIVKHLLETQMGIAANSAASAAFGEWAHHLFSATTPFGMAMQFGVLPQFAQARYVVVYDAAQNTFSMVWGAFVTSTPTPDFRVGAWALLLRSEGLGE